MTSSDCYCKICTKSQINVCKMVQLEYLDDPKFLEKVLRQNGTWFEISIEELIKKA